MTTIPWGEWLRRRRAWVLVGLAILFVVIVRVRLRDVPLERDEGEYAYAGQLILQGVPPYREAYNMKLPGTYAAYAVIMALFGQTPAGIHLGLALVNAASVVLVFLLGRKLLDEATGTTTAVAFALLSLSPSVLGLAAHATHFIVLAALAGILLLLHALTEQNAECRMQNAESPITDHASRITFPLLLAASGFLFGLAFLMKQHGLFFGVFGALYLLWVRGSEWLAEATGQSRQASMRRSHRQSGSALISPASLAALRRMALDLGWFSLGWALPYGLTCLVLWWAGAFHEFVFWTITYAAKYASAVSLVDGPAMLRTALHTVVGPNLALWVLPWIGALMMWWENRLDLSSQGARRKSNIENRKSQIPHARFFLTALLFCSFASTSIGLYFRSHYFITVLPVLALLTGVAVSRALHLLRHDTTIELFLAIPILGLFAIALGAALIGNGAVWLTLPPDRALRSIYGSTLFLDTARAADYIKAHTPRNARIAVLGSEPEIYFLAHRRSASGYIYMYSLMETHPYALEMQNQMISEIERTRPEYLVYIDDTLSWLKRTKSEQKVFTWWNAYWAKHLDLVRTTEIEEAPSSDIGQDIPADQAPAGKHILIFKRRG